jgi:hypothetical protein
VDINIMERVNNTLRGRERNYRGLNIDETPMIPFYTACYNLVREHQAINKSPANAAGIDLKLGHDKWNDHTNINKQGEKLGFGKRNECYDLFGSPYSKLHFPAKWPSPICDMMGSSLVFSTVLSKSFI